MLSLEQNLRRNKLSPISFLGGIVLTTVVFIFMGLMHFDIEMPEPETAEPISDFHLPPSPPPPPADQPLQKTNVSISFDVPATDGPADIPLGFLDVDFGLKPKELTSAQVDVQDSLDSFKTDGLETLQIYSQEEVTEKPKRVYQPLLDIPMKYKRINGNKPITFVVLYTVTTKGRTTNIHVLDCPVPEIIPIIERYIGSWRLKPALKDGEPVNSWVQHKFTYRPSSNSSPFSL